MQNQVHVLSVDTSVFFNEQEKSIHSQILVYQNIINDLENGHRKFSNRMKKKIKSIGVREEIADIQKSVSDESQRIDAIVAYLKKLLVDSKKELSLSISMNKSYRSLNYNDVTTFKHSKRVFRVKKMVSIFESELTRTIGCNTNEFTDNLIIIRVYYMDILKTLIEQGFDINGERYIFFSASAGQIRTKKVVFIKESVWLKNKDKLLCGLSVESINKQGGTNTNKYLAYLALLNSATEVWENFDIDRVVVVEDFETTIYGDVDYIDRETFDIERKHMGVPIPHMDGCGLISPELSDKNFMFRMPWVKGLLGVFDFKKFIQLHGCGSTITDIYGQEHDILKENIQIILTKSQFKMWKFYKSWDEYKSYFKQFGCGAARCNIEQDKIENSTLTYQMLQTLHDITEDEILKISNQSYYKIKNITSSLKTMLSALGVKKEGFQTYYQQALSLYPELVQDTWSKETIREIRNKMIKEAKSGKIAVFGKYTFVLPDLYAFCEWLFLGKENPSGLLKDGQVSCSLFQDGIKLDCLRNPHLYIEHAVRNNTINGDVLNWFSTKAIYTSVHDRISKILQFDCDGDTLLVVADQTIVKVAERNNGDVVPLYYNMNKSISTELSSSAIYEGLRLAFTEGDIGTISNDITKVWDKPIDTPMTEDDLKTIKLLCALTNFTIDYAKTLYKPTLPSNIKQLLKRTSTKKVPYFFISAKNKKRENVEKANKSVVNILGKRFKGFVFDYSQDNLKEFEYRKLLSNPLRFEKNRINRKKNYLEFLKEYDRINNSYRFKLSNMSVDVSKEESNYNLVMQEVKDKILAFADKYKIHRNLVSDILVEYLYGIKDSRGKAVLWACFGDELVENLKSNLNVSLKTCSQCGKKFYNGYNNQIYCSDNCYKKSKYIPVETKTLTCVDCGKLFRVQSKNTKAKRCNACQRLFVRQYDRERKRNSVQQFDK